MQLLLTCCVATLVGHASAQALGSLPDNLVGVQGGAVFPQPTPAPAPPPPAQDAPDEPLDAPEDFAQAVADDDDAQEAPRARGARERPATARARTSTTPLTKPEPKPAGHLPRQCECVEPTIAPDTEKIFVDDIRDLSNTWCDGGDRTANSFGLSNMVWAWGQFIDHDVVGSEPEPGAEFQFIKIDDRRMNISRTGPEIGAADEGTCGGPSSTHDGYVDGTPIYGTDEETEELLRDFSRGGCYLRATPGPDLEHLPLTTEPDDDGLFFIVAGDFRVEEQAILTAMHTVWMREHNRLCGELEKGRRTKDLSGDEQFEIAKATVIAKMHTITVNEFLPSLGIRDRDLKNAAKRGFADENGHFATVEFSIAYRLGHTLIPDTIGEFEIAEIFRSGLFFLRSTESGAGVEYRKDTDAQIDKMMKTLATVPAAEIDGKMSNALRNILFGPTAREDLCSRNIYRGRDLHVPSYKGLAECYGIEPHHQTEMETPDAFLGLMREPKQGKNPLGPTLKAIIVEHFGRVFFGPKGNFWRNTDLKQLSRPFAREIRRTTLAKVISMNSGAKLRGNTFKVKK